VATTQGRVARVRQPASCGRQSRRSDSWYVSGHIAAIAWAVARMAGCSCALQHDRNTRWTRRKPVRPHRPEHFRGLFNRTVAFPAALAVRDPPVTEPPRPLRFVIDADRERPLAVQHFRKSRSRVRSDAPRNTTVPGTVVPPIRGPTDSRTITTIWDTFSGMPKSRRKRVAPSNLTQQSAAAVLLGGVAIPFAQGFLIRDDAGYGR